MPFARLNTQVAFVPFLSTDLGRNVLHSTEMDKQFVVRSLYVGRLQQDKDIGIPQPTYIENVLPTSAGWDSVSYTTKINGRPGARFDKLINLKSGSETNILYSPAQGRNYVNYSGVWAEGPFNDKFAGLVTSAYIKLRSFIAYQRQKVIEYDFSGKAFKNVTLKGLDFQNIDGITAANNALIAWNETTIFWSSFIDPEDFVPSLSSGAGSQNPTQARGKIVACLPAADGFIIYTTANAIAASWSGSIRYPWKFTEVVGSAGITSIEHVTYDANFEGHFAWTVDGLQLVTKREAKQVYPEISDFLTGKLVEEYIGPTALQSHNSLADAFNSATQTWASRLIGPNLLQQFHLTVDPWVKLCLLGTRYFLISYGYKQTGIYDWVIVYDLVLQRYGKLKISHVDAFNYVVQPGEAPEVRNSIGFLAEDGMVSVVDFDQHLRGSGVLLYGRLQVAQGRWIEATSVEIQTVKDVNPSLLVIPTYDGLNPEQAEVPMPIIDTKNLCKWAMRTSGANISLLISGAFSISSILFEFNMLGDR